MKQDYMSRSVFVMTSSLISEPDIRAKMDQHRAGIVNIHVGTMYMSMTLEQFDELFLAVSAARVAPVKEAQNG
jgi:hypothetical protein